MYRMTVNYLALVFLLCSFSVRAAVFEITVNKPLPTAVTEHGVSFAYYNIKNISDTELENNYIPALPGDVTKVNCQPQFCQNKFTLEPNDSCVLKLVIRGPVDSLIPFQVCTSLGVCEDNVIPLSVKKINKLPFFGLGSGLYVDTAQQRFPLLAETEDNGLHWSFPSEIFTNLTSRIDSEFSGGSFAGNACTGENNKLICIASGQFSNSISMYPLIAMRTQKSGGWQYPQSIFKDVSITIDADFISGELRGASCSGSGGNSICLAAGNYYNHSGQLPLLAQTTNGGNDWVYPKSIFQNLTSTVDANFVGGFLDNVSCSRSTCQTVCVASGSYCNSDKCYPLLALSKNQGKDWSYPSDIFKNLTVLIDPNFGGGNLSSSSCTGSGNETVCAAAGAFFTPSGLFPLVAMTDSGGDHWFYPPTVFAELPSRIGHRFIGGLFNATSCTGSGRKSVCIAAGTFFRDGPNFPILAVTRNAGGSWEYPDFIYTKLKQVVDPQFVSGNFLGATCVGKGKNAICMAAGGYCRDAGCNRENPLIALSTNGGKSWSYPTSVFSDMTTQVDPNFQIGFFRSINCYGDEYYNFCVAAGQYSNDVTTFPMIAMSSDSGHTWTYSKDIFQNLQVKLDPNFSIGVFNTGKASGGKFAYNKNFFKRIHWKDMIFPPRMNKLQFD